MLIIQFKSNTDFSTAVTYLTNQTFCFDQHPDTKSLRFFLLSASERAMTELKDAHGIVGAFVEDLSLAL